MKKSAWMASVLLVLITGAASTRAASEDIIPRNAQSAIDRGLQWLAAQQRAEGAFDSNAGPSAAITSLSVMAFMARGHLPGQGPYGDSLNRGIDWVLAQQRPDGLIAAHIGHPIMYEHGISTVMLCEAYGMVDARRQERISRAVADAVRVILDAQSVPKNAMHTGGWRYSPTSEDADISVSGWQLMALRGAANVGAAVPEKALQDGVSYILNMASPNGGFGYTSNGDVSPARTGTGVLALELLGHHLAPSSIAGGDYLMSHPITRPAMGFYFYAVYYVSQAANQLGGKQWPGIYVPLRDGLVAIQNVDGSWGGGVAENNDIYCTSMAILGLCVPYRYLPLYQR